MTLTYRTRPVNRNRPFGLGVFPPQRDPKRPVGPDPLDSAWLLGYRLGRDGESGDPGEDASPTQAEAFRHGYNQGAAEFEAEEDTAMLAALADVCEADTEDGSWGGEYPLW